MSNEKKEFNYRIKHIGINNQDAAQANELLNQLTFYFDLVPQKDTLDKVFAGDIFEVQKHSRRGKNGHIALQTDDVEASMADLAAKGITFREETIRRDENGRINFVYLTQEFGGFAIHLTS